MPSQNTNFGLTLEQRTAVSIERLRSLKDGVLQQLRVSVPGIVQAFHPGPPATVDVLIVNDDIIASSPQGGPFSPTSQATPIPVLTGVPIVMPSGGGWNLTLPIQQGDECWVLFADSPIDGWFTSGKAGQVPISQRRHSLSDAVAIFGVRSVPNGLANYSTNSMQLRSDDGTVIIDMAENQVTVTAPNVVVNATTKVSISGPAVGIGDASDPTAFSTGIDGRLFMGHQHTGVQTGFSVSGPVWPSSTPGPTPSEP